MPIENHQIAAEKINTFLKMITGMGGLRLKYRITAGAGAADPNKFESREIYVELAGPDIDLVLERNAELLRSLEHIAAKTLRLEPEEHDLVSFDARGYKAARAGELRLAAETAAEPDGALGSEAAWASKRSAATPRPTTTAAPRGTAAPVRSLRLTDVTARTGGVRETWAADGAVLRNR